MSIGHFGVVNGPVKPVREGVAVGSQVSSRGSNAEGVRCTTALRAAVEGVTGPTSLDSAHGERGYGSVVSKGPPRGVALSGGTTPFAKRTALFASWIWSSRGRSSTFGSRSRHRFEQYGCVHLYAAHLGRPTQLGWNQFRHDQHCCTVSWCCRHCGTTAQA